MEIMKISLEKEIKRQHELLQQNVKFMADLERVEVEDSQIEKRNGPWEDGVGQGEEIDKEIETELGEWEEKRTGKDVNAEEGDNDELLDYEASQESFETKIKMAQKGEMVESKGRRGERLKDRGDQRTEDIAKERAAIKDDYGKKSLPTVLNSSSQDLLKIASGVGVNLGTQIDMVEHSINLIKNVEKTRVDLWLANNSNQNKTPVREPKHVIETGEFDIEELIADDSEGEDSDSENWEHLKKLFSNRKGKYKGKPPSHSGGKPSVVVDILQKNNKKKKK